MSFKEIVMGFTQLSKKGLFFLLSIGLLVGACSKEELTEKDVEEEALPVIYRNF